MGALLIVIKFGGVALTFSRKGSDVLNVLKRDAEICTMSMQILKSPDCDRRSANESGHEPGAKIFKG